MSAISKAEASVPPLLSPSWPLNFNGTSILCWNYPSWVTQNPEKNMEQNKNESWQWTRIIILGLFLIGFQGIYNTWIQSLVSFSVLQHCSSGIMRQQAEWSRDTLLQILAFNMGKQEVGFTVASAPFLSSKFSKITCRFWNIHNQVLLWVHRATARSAAEAAEDHRTSTFTCSPHSNFTPTDVAPIRFHDESK